MANLKLKSKSSAPNVSRRGQHANITVSRVASPTRPARASTTPLVHKPEAPVTMAAAPCIVTRPSPAGPAAPAIIVTPSTPQPSSRPDPIDRGPVQGIEIRMVAGLDLGQKQDHSALAIIELRKITWQARDAGTWEHLTSNECILTHIERVPLNLPYPEIVRLVRDRLQVLPPNIGQVPLVVDATGGGGPVVDLIRAAGLGRNLIPVVITSGDSVTKTSTGSYGVPKRELITGLQIAFEARQLEISAGLGGSVELLIGELMAMRTQTTPAGNEKFGVWRDGLHDDLVLATALAWWQIRQMQNSPRGWNKK